MLTFIKDVASELTSRIEASGLVNSCQSDLLKDLIEAQLKKIGFVSREEFDAQTQVLEKNIVTIKELEDKIDKLEKRVF